MMDNKEFKNILRIYLDKNGFIYKNKCFYKYTNDLIVVVDLQKSNYQNSFYINYAFFVKDIYNGVEYPRTNMGDIRGRFVYNGSGAVLDYFSLDSLSQNEFRDSLEENINTVLKPVIEGGLIKYLEMFPKAIFTATKKLQLYLRCDE